MTARVKMVSSKEITPEKGLLPSKYIPDPKEISTTLVKNWVNDYAIGKIDFTSEAATALRERIEKAIVDMVASGTVTLPHDRGSIQTKEG